MTYELLIGIDPGVNTGFAVWDGERLTRCESHNIVEAAMLLKEYIDEHEIKVFYEDARLRHWFGSAGREKLMGAGSVRRDSQIWETICKVMNIPYEAVAPKDNKTKLTSQQFKLYTGWQGTTNEHARDAAMLVYGRKMKEIINYQDWKNDKRTT